VLHLPLIVALLIAFAVTQLANLVTTLYLHRTLAHRSMTMSKPLEFASRVVLWLTMGIDRREWVAVHRKHHIFSDEPSDPHSPIQKGVGHVVLFNAAYYRSEAKRADTIEAHGRDIAPDRWEWALFSTGLLGVGIGIALPVLLFGPVSAAIIAVAHTVMYIGLGGCVNGFGHWFGKRPHDNKATNLRWLAMLTAGEGMHNEHHHRPRSPRFGRSWWDVGGKLASAMARIRLVTLHESSRVVREQAMAAG
jgi:stearoyl-CoA desaturase (delta-9 desaturase)